jgi:hypothetical protein
MKSSWLALAFGGVVIAFLVYLYAFMPTPASSQRRSPTPEVTINQDATPTTVPAANQPPSETLRGEGLQIQPVGNQPTVQVQ